ncbi:MAG: Abi family protein [Clostridiaceae bacterium]
MDIRSRFYYSDKYRGDYAYLAIENYSKEKANLSLALKNIATLSTEINKNTLSNRAKSSYISHYIENHESVPLWVLVNSLTIGNMSYFYSAIDRDVKEEVAKDFSIQHKREYASVEKIGSDELTEVLKAVNLFRNVCAHEEVLFLFKLLKPTKYKFFTKYFRDSCLDENSLKESNLYTLICFLKLVLPRLEYTDLIMRLDSLFTNYESVFKSVNFKDIVKLSGFKDTWKEDLAYD